MPSPWRSVGRISARSRWRRRIAAARRDVRADAVQVVDRFEQWVGLDDSLIHKITLNVAIDLDLTLFAVELGVVTGSLVLESEIADFNQKFEVAVPESYKSLDDLNLEGLEDLEELELEL